MDISVKSDQSVQFMVNAIKEKLRMATGDALRPHHFSVDHYEDIKDIYELVSAKPHFSISEMEAIVSELGKLRQK